MRLLMAYGVGLIFGLGIAISGMANPAKVINFFDIAGTWDPSLAFVMGGALVVTAIGYRTVFKRGAPVCAASFDIPTNRRIDVKLIAGAAIFGIGWGIAGFCPGGALPALGAIKTEVFVFTGSLIAGIWGTKWVQGRMGARGADRAVQVDG